MKKLALFLSLFFFASNAQAKLTIFACEPEWGSLAREIVGAKADVVIAITPQQDPAKVRVTSDLLKVMATADMVFCTGDMLEVKWLETALNKSYNIKVQTNATAKLLAADYSDRIAVDEPVVDPNKKFNPITDPVPVRPRVHLNPHNITKVAAEFVRRVKLLDQVNSIYYQKSYDNFMKKWSRAIQTWESVAMPLKGMKVVINNDAWLQLTNWLGLEVVGKINATKGYITNTQHLNQMVKDLKENPAQAIIFANYEDKKSILWLSEKTNTRVVLLPFTVGGAANSNDLINMFSTTINLLLADCKKTLCPSISIAQEKQS